MPTLTLTATGEFYADCLVDLLRKPDIQPEQVANIRDEMRNVYRMVGVLGLAGPSIIAEDMTEDEKRARGAYSTMDDMVHFVGEVEIKASKDQNWSVQAEQAAEIRKRINENT